jgi:hypothetical protein
MIVVRKAIVEQTPEQKFDAALEKRAQGRRARPSALTLASSNHADACACGAEAPWAICNSDEPPESRWDLPLRGAVASR